LEDAEQATSTMAESAGCGETTAFGGTIAGGSGGNGTFGVFGDHHDGDSGGTGLGECCSGAHGRRHHDSPWAATGGGGDDGEGEFGTAGIRVNAVAGAVNDRTAALPMSRGRGNGLGKTAAEMYYIGDVGGNVKGQEATAEERAGASMHCMVESTAATVAEAHYIGGVGNIVKGQEDLVEEHAGSMSTRGLAEDTVVRVAAVGSAVIGAGPSGGDCGVASQAAVGGQRLAGRGEEGGHAAGAVRLGRSADLRDEVAAALMRVSTEEAGLASAMRRHELYLLLEKTRLEGDTGAEAEVLRELYAAELIAVQAEEAVTGGEGYVDGGSGGGGSKPRRRRRPG
jgi:hypothetical protein